MPLEPYACQENTLQVLTLSPITSNKVSGSSNFNGPNNHCNFSGAKIMKLET